MSLLPTLSGALLQRLVLPWARPGTMQLQRSSGPLVAGSKG